MSDTARVKAAKEADRAERIGVLRTLVRFPADMADLMIAEYEAATGFTATAEDLAEAKAYAERQFGSPP